MSCGARKPPRERRIVGEAREVEYWILELAVEGRIPLRFLTSDNLGPLFNVRFDGFERAGLIAGLERLLAARDIEMRENDEVTPLDRAGLEDALDRPVPPPPVSAESLEPFYGLTAQGGVRWETWAGLTGRGTTRCRTRSAAESGTERSQPSTGAGRRCSSRA